MSKSFELHVELELNTDQLGTIPKDEEVFKAYLKHRAKGKEQKDEFKSPLSDEQIDEREAKGWTGFMEEDGNPFVLEYMIKGFLKNSARVQKQKSIKIANLASKVNDYVFISPRKIFFEHGKKGDALERPLRAMTPQGPRVSLARSDSMKPGAKLNFKISVPIPCEITEKVILALLDYGQFMGLGQFRNGGYGRFKYKIVK